MAGTSAAGLPTAGGAAPRLVAANASAEGARGRGEPRDARGRASGRDTRARLLAAWRRSCSLYSAAIARRTYSACTSPCMRTLVSDAYRRAQTHASRRVCAHLQASKRESVRVTAWALAQVCGWVSARAPPVFDFLLAVGPRTGHIRGVRAARQRRPVHEAFVLGGSLPRERHEGRALEDAAGGVHRELVQQRASGGGRRREGLCQQRGARNRRTLASASARAFVPRSAHVLWQPTL